MKAVIQRVRSAKVDIDGKSVAEIGQGLLVLVGVAKADSEAEAEKLTEKIVNLRIFADNDNKFNLSLTQVRGEILLVPQFTLFGEVKGQNRPYFDQAAKPDKAKYLYNYLVTQFEKLKITAKSGIFGAYMQIKLVNDGPVTLILNTEEY